MEPLEGEIILAPGSQVPATTGDDLLYPKERYCESVYSCNDPTHPRSEGSSSCDLPMDYGVMQENVDSLAEHIVGHRIVKFEQNRQVPGSYRSEDAAVITLDTGVEVQLIGGSDCCAFTYLDSFLASPDKVDHIITGVGTTDGYSTWHIYCDFGDIMQLNVAWDCGNPFYYGYGFDIKVAVNAETFPALESGKKAIEG